MRASKYISRSDSPGDDGLGAGDLLEQELAGFDGYDVSFGSDSRALAVYLREIGAIPPLSHDAEVMLAKQKEEGEALALHHTLANDLALAHVLRLGEALLRNEIAIEDIVDGHRELSTTGYPASAEISAQARDEFLRGLQEVRKLDAARRNACEPAGGPKADGAQEALLHTARDEVYAALRKLCLGRAVTDKIAEALNCAWQELQHCDRQSSDALRRIGRIERSLGITAAQLGRDLDAIRRGNSEARKAKNTLIESNLRLAVAVARRYRRSGFPLADLIQEGSLGLMRAAEKFDYRLGCRFSTYATWWIRQTIARSIINFGQMIRVPVQLVEARRKLRRKADSLTGNLEQKLFAERLAEKSDLPVKIVETIMRLPRQPVSLHTPVAAGEDKLLEYYLEDRRAVDPSQQALQQIDLAAARKQLGVLTRRQEIVVRHRFGIEMNRDHTLQEIGDLFAITRERARQIESQGLRRLRASAAHKRARGGGSVGRMD